MAPVVIMLRIIFCADEAFMRVEPEMTSGPTSAQMDVGDLGELRVDVAGDGCGFGASGASVVDGTDDVGRAAGGRHADDDVFPCRPSAGDVALTDLRRIFVDVGGGGQSLRSASHDVLHLLRGGGKGGRALGGVEGSDATRRAGADVDEPAAVAEGAGDGVDDHGDFG